MNPEQQPTPISSIQPTPVQNSTSAVTKAPAIASTSQLTQTPNSVITPGVPEIGSLEAAPTLATQGMVPSPAAPTLNESIYAVAPEPPVAQSKKISWAPGIPKRSFLVVGLIVLVCAATTLFVMNRHTNTPQSQVNNQEPSSNTLGDVSAESVTFGIDTKIANGKKLTASGPVAFKNDTDSTKAFTVQDASGTSLINVDTKTGTVTINGKLNAPNIVSSSTQLSPNVTQAGNSFNGALQLVQLGPSGILPALNGSALLALNAGNISSGTLPDARLSSNVTLKNSNNNLFKPGADSTNTFQIQNSAGTTALFLVDTSNRRVAINQTSANYTLDVNGDINVTAGGSIRINGVALCSGAGCTAASGSGSYIQNRTSVQSANFAVQSADVNSVAGLVKGASGQIANIFQVNDGFNDTVFSVGPTGNVLIQPGTDSTNAFWVQNAAGTSHLIGGDTVNDRVAIAMPTPPTYTLDVGGDINSTTAIRVGGNIICSAGGCTPGAGSGNYIQNSTSLQTANFAIQSDANNHVVATIRGASGQTADLFDLVAGDSGQSVATVGARGNVLFQNATDSTTAFQIQNQAGNSNLFVADTQNTRIGIGAVPTSSLLTIGTNTTTSAGGVTFGTDTQLYRNGAGNLILAGGASNAGTLQAATAVGADVAGSSLILAGGAGTGIGNGGNINLQIAKPSVNVPSQSFITGLSSAGQVAVNNNYIFWVNSGTKIGRANLDGTNANPNFITSGSIVALAANNNYVYWTIGGGSIGRANVDGTGVNNSFITGQGAAIRGIAVDSNYIYFTDAQGAFAIGRANLDGTNVQALVTSISQAGYGIAVDGSHVYWTFAATSLPGNIGRANLDGTGVNQSFMTGANTASAEVAVDSGHLYWSVSGGNIGRANLDGSSINTSYITGSNTGGVAVDSSFLYWTNSSLLTVGRYSFGSGANSLSTVATISGVNGSALFQNATDNTNAFQVKNAAGSNLLNVSSSGSSLTANTSALFQNAADSMSAFQVQNAAGTSNLLVADTINSKIGIGTSSPIATLAIKDNFSSPVLSANLTASGSEINDAMRAEGASTTNVAGHSYDGITSDSSYGVWESVNNLVANGGFESSTSGWTSVSSSVSSSSIAKFGSRSAQIVTSNSTANEGAYTTFVQSSNQIHTVSVWAKASTGSPTVRLRLTDNTPTAVITSSPVTLSSTSWTRLTLTTSSPLGSGTFRLYVETDVQQNTTFYIDGAQAEARPYATPYVETNGTTQTRSAGNITAPSSLLNQAQGWIAIRFRMDQPASRVGDIATFNWTDGTNQALLRIHGGGGGPTSDVRFGVNSALALKSNVDITQTNLYTLVAFWTGSQIGVSVNGSAFSTTSYSGMPTINSSSFTIANSSTDSDVFWFAAGKGTLSAADASTLNTYGNTDPTLTNLSTSLLTGLPTMIWNANSTTYQWQTGINNPIALQVQDASANNLITVNATSDAGSVLVVGTNTTTSTGGISFGTDTNLYRSASNTLKTDGTLAVGSGAGGLLLSNPGGSGMLQVAASAGADVAGSNLILAGGQGTGAGNGGNINLQIAKPNTNGLSPSFMSVSSPTGPFGVAVDNNFIYWINAPTNSIGRANIDGTGVNTSFITGISGAVGLAVDNTYIYWSTGTAIGRANLDGTGANGSFITGLSGVPQNIVVNTNYIYWGEYNGDTVARANIDGTGVNQSFISGVVGEHITDVAIDSSHIYWTNSHSLGRANLDGTGANNSLVAIAVGTPQGITVTPTFLYWTNSSGTIGRASLDGTGSNSNFITASGNLADMTSSINDVYWANQTNHAIGRLVFGTAANSLSTVASLSGSTGSALFQNAADSISAFQIQNASGTNLFTVDTTNMQINLGSASSTPVILVLGVKNTSGDPAGGCTSGGIYYNSSSNQFRGCDNGAYNNLAGVDVVTTLPTTNLYDGRQVRIRAGSSPYDMLTLTYDATYGKWVSDQQPYTGIITQGTSYLGNANRSLGSNTAGTFIGLPVVPLRGPTNAGLHPQIRFMMSTYDNGSAHGTVSVAFHTSNNGGTMSGINSFATFIPTDSYPTSEVFEDSGWKDLSSYTNADNLEPDLYITASSSGASIGINNLTCYVRWVSN
ncbi:MAG TPA: DUF5050 domain-containing protein [Candidatus Saccharimonadales bacterium]|nr:DUF5050 domain-containing protein [Candidatus Saccharimonadales bacterium]